MKLQTDGNIVCIMAGEAAVKTHISKYVTLAEETNMRFDGLQLFSFCQNSVRRKKKQFTLTRKKIRLE